MDRHIKTENLDIVNISVTMHCIQMLVYQNELGVNRNIKNPTIQFQYFLTLIMYVKYAKLTTVYIRVDIKHMLMLMNFAITGWTQITFNTIATVTSPLGVLFLAVCLKVRN